GDVSALDRVGSPAVGEEAVEESAGLARPVEGGLAAVGPLDPRPVLGLLPAAADAEPLLLERGHLRVVGHDVDDEERLGRVVRVDDALDLGVAERRPLVVDATAGEPVGSVLGPGHGMPFLSSPRGVVVPPVGPVGCSVPSVDGVRRLAFAVCPVRPRVEAPEPRVRGGPGTSTRRRTFASPSCRGGRGLAETPTPTISPATPSGRWPSSTPPSSWPASWSRPRSPPTSRRW